MTTEGAEVPTWLVEGASVRHDTFGTGLVSLVGDHNGMPTVWIDFDYGERKALSLQFGIWFLQPRAPWTRKTRPNPSIRCGVCGSRPVTLSVDERQFCDAHRTMYRPMQ